MNRNLAIGLVVLVFFCLPFTYGGCSGGGGGDGIQNSGSWFAAGFNWSHDGEPFESENFTIYSDAASADARQDIAALAETALSDIKFLFEIENNEIFIYPPGQDKMDIYAYKSHTPLSWGGWAYYGGLLIYSLDHPQRGDWGHTEPEIFVPTLTHETMHVVESLLKASGDPNTVDVWLTEGLAEAVSGGTAGGRIMTLAKLNELRQTYGWSLNPISMHVYDYPDIEGVIFNYYYPMFQLAVEYLVDIDGHAKNYTDIKNLFLDVSVGVPFEIAFETRFEMSLAEYEVQFFDLINIYLNAS